MKANYMERRYEKVRLRAYEIWQEEGKPEGRDLEFWRRAEAEIPEETDSDHKSSSDSGGGSDDPAF
jgi:hypothetical protein